MKNYEQIHADLCKERDEINKTLDKLVPDCSVARSLREYVAEISDEILKIELFHLPKTTQV